MGGAVAVRRPTVREVLAHMIAGASLNPVRWLPRGTGSGPLAAGATLALIMAMAGRRAYCDELQGDGSATLRERSQTS